MCIFIDMRPFGLVTTLQNGAIWRPQCQCVYLCPFPALLIAERTLADFSEIPTDIFLSDGIKQEPFSLSSDLMLTLTPDEENLGYTPKTKWR